MRESPRDRRLRSFAARVGQDSGRSAPCVQPNTPDGHHRENVRSARDVLPRSVQFSVATNVRFSVAIDTRARRQIVGWPDYPPKLGPDAQHGKECLGDEFALMEQRERATVDRHEDSTEGRELHVFIESVAERLILSVGQREILATTSLVQGDELLPIIERQGSPTTPGRGR